MNTLMNRSALCIAAVLLTSLAGCSGSQEPKVAASTPTSSTSAAPTASADPLSTVDHIELEAEQLVMFSGKTTISTLSMKDSAASLSAMKTVLGEPKTDTVAAGAGGQCTVAHTSYSWGDSAISLIAWTDTPSAGKPAYDVRIATATVTSGAGKPIALTGSGGVTVGQDIAGLIAAAPAANKDSYVASGVTNHTVVLQQGWSDGVPAHGVSGVSAFTTGTIVTTIGSPVPVNSNQDC